MNPLSLISDLGGKILDHFVPDKTARDEAKAELEKAALKNDAKLQMLAHQYETAIVQAQRDIIVAESQTAWWKTARGLVLVLFALIVSLHLMGWAAPAGTIPPAEMEWVFRIIFVAMTGYVGHKWTTGTIRARGQAARMNNGGS